MVKVTGHIQKIEGHLSNLLLSQLDKYPTFSHENLCHYFRNYFLTTAYEIKLYFKTAILWYIICIFSLEKKLH
jgi:hypothetical protein